MRQAVKLTLHLSLLLAILASLSVSLVGQPAKPKMPDEGYAVRPLLIKDEGCARDYVKASATAGIELRKRMAELVTYECIERTVHIYRVFVAKSLRVPANPKPAVFMDVMMLRDRDLEKLSNHGREIVDSDEYEPLSKHGLILASEFLPYSRERVEVLIKSAGK